MNLLSKRNTPACRTVMLALGAAWLLSGALPLTTAATPVPKTAVSTEASAALQTWQLASGGHVKAAIVGYSLQSRVILLRSADGTVGHLSPRELTAMSKLQWLASPVFLEALRGYRPTAEAIGDAAAQMAAPTLGVFLGGFVAFWMALALIDGKKRLLPAARSYATSTLLALVVASCAIAAILAITKGLGDSPVTPLLCTAVTLLGAGMVLVVASCRIGSDFDLSGGGGFGVVLATGGLAFVMATLTLYLLPRFLEQPGLDDWLTDRLLTPLGLA